MLDEIGGWDKYALAKDAEQSLTLTARDYLIAIEPRSQSWKQESEKFSVWFKQRTRWMIDNLYLVQKIIATKEYRSRRKLWNDIQLISVYYVFFIHICHTIRLMVCIGSFGYILSRHSSTPINPMV